MPISRPNLPLAPLALALAAAVGWGQCLEQRIDNPAPAEGATFGTGVWLDGGTLMVTEVESAHVYRWTGDRWALQQSFGLEGGFGTQSWIDRADFDGQRLIAGGNGEALVFAQEGGRFTLEQRLETPDPDRRAFGETVAIEGDTLVAGQRGYLWVYRREADGWRQVQFIDYPSGTGLDRYGYWLELEEGWLAVSAHYTDAGGVDRAGAVAAFPQRPDGTFGELQILTVSDPGHIEEINKPVLRNGVLAVTSRGEDPRGGTQIVAHTFVLDGGSWVYDQAVRGSAMGDLYTSTVHLSPDAGVLLLGGPDAHGLYAFERDAEGVYAEVARIDDGHGAGVLIGGLATDGRTAFAGSPRFRVDGISEVGAVAVVDVLCERCTADLNGDGRADTADLLAFLNFYEMGDPIADFDGDGVLTAMDLDVFQTALDAGCPPRPTGCQPRVVETLVDLGRLGDVLVEGDLAYAHSATRGFLVLDVRDPTAPVVLGSLPASDFAGRIAKRGDTVYFAGPDRELSIADVSDPASPVVLATHDAGEDLFNAAVSGDLIAMTRARGGAIVFDARNPRAPVRVGQIAGSESVGRDGHFLAAAGAHLERGSLAVYDADLTLVAEARVHGEGLTITLDGPGDVAFVHSLNFSGPLPIGGFITAFDVRDPADPVELGSIQGAGRFSLAERNGYLYAGDHGGIYVYDVRDPANMRFARFLPYPARDVALLGHHLWAFGDDGNLYVSDIATCLPCRADLDGDGRATVYDILAFIHLYQAGSPSADFNQDGLVNVVDLLGFQRAVLAGCE